VIMAANDGERKPRHLAPRRLSASSWRRVFGSGGSGASFGAVLDRALQGRSAAGRGAGRGGNPSLTPANGAHEIAFNLTIITEPCFGRSYSWLPSAPGS
jgi:hypothetical protein